LYVALAIFMAGLVTIGFWPSYFGLLFTGGPALPLVVDIHAAVFTGWMALFLAQIVLAWTGNVAAHRRAGRWGIAYGALVVVVGVVVGIAGPILRVRAGDFTRDEMAAFLLAPLGDITLFACLFAAAAVYRRRPETHKRLMLLATVALIGPALVRIPAVQDSIPLLFGLAWLPVILAMLHDWRTRGRVHNAYLAGGLALLVVGSRMAAADSDAWMTIGRAILAVFSS
jgi:hypothetical protein